MAYSEPRVRRMVKAVRPRSRINLPLGDDSSAVSAPYISPGIVQQLDDGSMEITNPPFGPGEIIQRMPPVDNYATEAAAQLLQSDDQPETFATREGAQWGSNSVNATNFTSGTDPGYTPMYTPPCETIRRQSTSIANESSPAYDRPRVGSAKMTLLTDGAANLVPNTSMDPYYAAFLGAANPVETVNVDTGITEVVPAPTLWDKYKNLVYLGGGAALLYYILKKL